MKLFVFDWLYYTAVILLLTIPLSMWNVGLAWSEYLLVHGWTMFGMCFIGGLIPTVFKRVD